MREEDLSAWLKLCPTESQRKREFLSRAQSRLRLVSGHAFVRAATIRCLDSALIRRNCSSG